MKFAYATAGVGTGGFGYGGLIEKTALKTEMVTCAIPEKYQHLHGLKIGLLADLHFDEYGDSALVHHAVKVINQEKVDLVMLAGDFVSDKAASLEPLGEILKDLRAGIGVFAVLGNHDHWMGREHAVKFLKRSGIRLLKNESEDLGDFLIAGQESAWGGRPDFSKIPSRSAVDKPIILGWHEPDTFDWYEDDRVILQLSGHTHGGQICVPGYGPVLLPFLGKKYSAGLYQRGSGNLYVSRGLGVITIPARFCCPPEVTLLTLESRVRKA